MPRYRSVLVDFTGLFIIGLVIYIISFGNSTRSNDSFQFIIPPSLLNVNTIFLSIIIEAIPFVLIGVLIAGFIQIFITEDHIKKWIPSNKYLAVLMSCTIGALFPACECGIVPIVRRLLAKGVPLHAGIGFMLTGPLINPIVILSTYMAFGNDLKIAGLRMGLGFVIALIVAFIISILFKKNQIKSSTILRSTPNHSVSVSQKVGSTLRHAIDEFFDMGKYLIIGAFIAACVQTYVSMETLLLIGSGLASSTIVMMGLAYLLSLCSEADAFIGASFRNIFPTSAIMGFLVFGPMIDLKNTFMLLGVFRAKFVLQLLILVAVTVFTSILLIDRFI